MNLFIQTGENLELNNQYRMVDGGQNTVILPLVSQICSGKPILALKKIEGIRLSSHQSGWCKIGYLNVNEPSCLLCN